MSEKKPAQQSAAPTEATAQPAAKNAPVVVHTDNSKNGYLEARRAARSNANKGAN